MKHSVILEPSTNTHVMHANNEVEVKDMGKGVLKLKLKGDGIVSHGEHGTLKTEKENVIKYVQQELNPVTRAMQNAFD